MDVEDWVLVSTLAAASLTDWRRRRVPNWLVAAAMAVGIACQGGPFARSALGMAMAGFPLFYLRMIGGGDVKLMAVICGYLGIRDGCLAIGYGLVIGAAWALVRLLHKDAYLERVSYFIAWFRQITLFKRRIAYFVPARDGYGATIPLAACLFLGTLLSLWLRL